MASTMNMRNRNNVKKVVLADAQPIVRHGLKTLLESDKGFKVVAEVNDGLEAIRVVEQLRPDVLVLDPMVNGINGIEVTRRLSRRAPGTAIIILSVHNSESMVVEALQAGAKAYVLKDASSEELILAVRKVAAGQRFLSSSLSERAIQAYAKTPTYTLTTRELEVMTMVARGHTSTDIANQLSISHRTVDVHRANIMRKLGFKSKTELVRYALQHGNQHKDA
jgi:DNA-binding NarL/FixJ family response regulator